VAITLQWSAKAYRCDFGGHPDEGAHFVTGLMVRDYLHGGIPQHPMHFAEGYIEHYPKVAIGHYPPGFYALEGMWLSVFPVNRGSVLVFMAVLAGTFGMLVFRTASHRLESVPLAAVLALTAIALPLTQTMTFTVMADLALAIFVWLAGLAFVKFMETKSWLHSLGFGLWATAAIMTKGSGLFLALVPPLAIVLTGQYRLLKVKALWIAVVPVVLVCAPWMLYSSKITAEGMIDRSPLEHIQFALPYFGRQFWRVFGVILLPAVAGLYWIWKKQRSGEGLRLEPFWAVAIALPICLVVFFSGIPAGLEPRYLMPIVPSILVLAGGGLLHLRLLIPGAGGKRVGWEVAAVAVVLFGAGKIRLKEKDFAGFDTATTELFDSLGNGSKPMNILVSSDARGEGAFISEVAIRDGARTTHTVARGSKVLSKSDWLGREYTAEFGTDAGISEHLEVAGYDAVFVDLSIPKIFQTEHHGQIARVMEGEGDFERLPAAEGELPFSRRYAIYVRKTALPDSR